MDGKVCVSIFVSCPESQESSSMTLCQGESQFQRYNRISWIFPPPTGSLNLSENFFGWMVSLGLGKGQNLIACMRRHPNRSFGGGLLDLDEEVVVFMQSSAASMRLDFFMIYPLFYQVLLVHAYST